MKQFWFVGTAFRRALPLFPPQTDLQITSSGIIIGAIISVVGWGDGFRPHLADSTHPTMSESIAVNMCIILLNNRGI